MKLSGAGWIILFIGAIAYFFYPPTAILIVAGILIIFISWLVEWNVEEEEGEEKGTITGSLYGNVGAYAFKLATVIIICTIIIASITGAMSRPPEKTRCEIHQWYEGPADFSDIFLLLDHSGFQPEYSPKGDSIKFKPCCGNLYTTICPANDWAASGKITRQSSDGMNSIIKVKITIYSEESLIEKADWKLEEAEGYASCVAGTVEKKFTRGLGMNFLKNEIESGYVNAPGFEAGFLIFTIIGMVLARKYVGKERDPPRRKGI